LTTIELVVSSDSFHSSVFLLELKEEHGNGSSAEWTTDSIQQLRVVRHIVQILIDAFNAESVIATRHHYFWFDL
jgi:hypothetical protein